MDFFKCIEGYAKDTDKIAQIYGETKLSYESLKVKSDALANYIIELLGKDKSPILIYGHKDNEMLISFFACTKSGHAYIPIDTTFPEARVMDIIKSSNAKILINLVDINIDYKELTIINKVELDAIINKNLGKAVDESYMVKENENYYILYTSGSTGAPKGVQITKKCMCTFIDWFKDYCKISEDKNIVMNQVSYSFDVSVISVYIGLMMGKTLYVIDKEMVSNYKLLFDNFKKSEIALWVSTPSFIEMCLIDENFNIELLPEFENAIFAGEVLTRGNSKSP